jgi:putative ABC transport system ATP-binding protein
MIQIDHIHKYFQRGQSQENHAIRGIELNIKDGEFITVIGTNGAGKSTLLNCIAGLWPIDSGRIIIDGQDVTNLSVAERAKWIGRVFQYPAQGTASNLSIAENLALALLRGKRRWLNPSISGVRKQNFRTALAEFGLGLEDQMDAPVGQLSNGQRQAVTLLMATLNAPRILLLDEHTASLDPTAAFLVMQFTAKFVAKYNLTTLMVTHDIHRALNMGDRILMIRRGQISLDIQGIGRAELTVEKLLQKYRDDNTLMLEDKLLSTI